MIRNKILMRLMDGFLMPTRICGSRFDWDRREYIQREPDPSQLGLFARVRLWLIEKLAN